jgi:hypothetical protein
VDGEADDMEARRHARRARASRAYRAGAAAERARCAAIFSAPSAAANPDLAAHLAFNTTLSPGAALETLARGGTSARPLATRMAGLGLPNPGPNPRAAPRAPAHAAGGWDKFFSAARGDTPMGA